MAVLDHGLAGRHPELAKFYPTSVLVTGYDIIFFWVARMMMFGTFVGDDDVITLGGQRGPQVPFENVFLHGLIRDGFGRKMEASQGNGIDPLDWVETFGADALRFTLARGASPAATCRSARTTPRVAQLRHQDLQRHPVRPDERCRAGAAAGKRPTPTGGFWDASKRFWIRPWTPSSTGPADRSTTSPGTSSRLVRRAGEGAVGEGISGTTAVLATVLDALLSCCTR